jgi:hypothetical protein
LPSDGSACFEVSTDEPGVKSGFPDTVRAIVGGPADDDGAGGGGGGVGVGVGVGAGVIESGTSVPDGGVTEDVLEVDELRGVSDADVTKIVLEFDVMEDVPENDSRLLKDEFEEDMGGVLDPMESTLDVSMTVVDPAESVVDATEDL